jgi:hypothetical protein
MFDTIIINPKRRSSLFHFLGANVMEKLIAFLQSLKCNGSEEMDTSAEGIVEKASTLTGVVRAQDFEINMVNEVDESVSNAKCKITFQNGQTLDVESDSQGVLKFVKKTSGEFQVKLLEDETSESKVDYPPNIQELPVLKLCNRKYKPNPIKGSGPLGNKKKGRLYYKKEGGDPSFSELVTLLQKMLDELIYPLGPAGIDGDFGRYTEKAVKKFQSEYSDFQGRQLKRNRKVGPMTADALNRAMVGIWFPFYETPIELTEDTLLVTVTKSALKTGVLIDPKDAKKAKLVLMHISGEITKVEWEKPEVVAYDRTKKDNRKVKFIVETKSIEDDTKAIVGVYQFNKNGKHTLCKRIKDLKIKRDQLVGGDDKPYEFRFKWHRTIYSYKRTQYFLKIKIGRLSKAGEQTKDKMIRLKHLDGIVANPDDTLPNAGKEGKVLRAYFRKKGPWVEATEDRLEKNGHEVKAYRGKASNVTLSKFSRLVRRSKFLHHQASHGDAYCENHTPKIAVELSGAKGADGVEEYYCPRCKNNDNVSGVICLKTDDFERSDVTSLSRSPRVLVLANCCLTAITDTFPKAWLSKRTRWYIGWAVPVGDKDALDFAKEFYKRWFEHYEMNPKKVKKAFDDVEGSYWEYRPRIFKK